MPGEVNIPHPHEAELSRMFEEKQAQLEELQERHEREREAEIAAQALRDAADELDGAADQHNEDIARIARVPKVCHDTGTSHGMRRAARVVRERADRLEADHG